MCGFTGFIQPGLGEERGRDILSAMAVAIEHRGPDDMGIWFDPDTGAGFGHRRLAIVDLSAQGHQPMLSATGRYVLSYNGEVYNFQQIRKELEEDGLAPIWKGHSDTEVLLAAIEAWGVQETLLQMTGMFAFSLWDREKRVLTLARDRIGEKPLYFGWQGDAFLFGSELKAFKSHPAFKGEIDRNVLTLFLRYNYIPAPFSIYKDVQKLEPGTFLQFSLNGEKGTIPAPHAYWSVRSAAEEGRSTPFTGTDAEAIESLDTLLRQTISNKMISDVPLGAFLSGGIDSSMVVALMQAEQTASVRTFSIGFHESTYNEAVHASAVANHLQTEHTELYVTPEQTLAVIPKLPHIYDEPFADSSQIPTFLLSQMTREHVTVALSGDGGDELFGGYNRYFLGRSLWNRLKWMPKWSRHVAASSLCLLSPQTLDRLFASVAPMLPQKAQFRMVGDRLHKLAGILPVGSPEEMYNRLISQWLHPETMVPGTCEPSTIMTDRSLWADLSDFTELMMFLDQVGYLPGDILTKVDRASMAVSLETRVPFLDHQLIEFAWRLPLTMKVRDGQGKWLLRQVLYKYVPKEMIERPKMGFGVPIDSWLRGPLREWAEELLDESRLQRDGYFNTDLIRKRWDEHLSGIRNWQYHLWTVLMFQAWLER